MATATATATAVSFGPITSDYFPDLVDKIIRESDYHSTLALRGTSHAFRDHIDYLTSHIAVRDDGVYFDTFSLSCMGNLLPLGEAENSDLARCFEPMDREGLESLTRLEDIMAKARVADICGDFRPNVFNRVLQLFSNLQYLRFLPDNNCPILRLSAPLSAPKVVVFSSLKYTGAWGYTPRWGRNGSVMQCLHLPEAVRKVTHNITIHTSWRGFPFNFHHPGLGAEARQFVGIFNQFDDGRLDPHDIAWLDTFGAQPATPLCMFEGFFKAMVPTVKYTFVGLEKFDPDMLGFPSFGTPNRVVEKTFSEMAPTITLLTHEQYRQTVSRQEYALEMEK